MGLFSTLLNVAGVVTGLAGAKSQKKAENNAIAQQNAEFEWQKEMYNRDVAPVAAENLRRMQKTSSAFNFLSDTQNNLLSGKGDVPWWAQVEGTSDADMADYEKSLSTLSDINIEDYAAKEAANVARYNASRGIDTSAEKAKELPGLRRQLTLAKAQEKANRTTAVLDEKRRRRGEQLGTLQSLAGMMGGYDTNPLPAASMGIGISQGQSSLFGQRAGEAGAGYQDAMNDLGALAGDYLGNKDWFSFLKKKNQPTGGPVYGGAITKVHL